MCGFVGLNDIIHGNGLGPHLAPGNHYRGKLVLLLSLFYYCPSYLTWLLEKTHTFTTSWAKAHWDLAGRDNYMVCKTP